MKKIFLHLVASFIFLQLFAQKEKFDIASFIPPQNWQRIDSNGIIAFLDSKTENGKTSFCQIFIYPSVQSTGLASSDFQSAWNAKVVKATATREQPQVQSAKSPEGWEVTTGYANINHMGITYTCMLVTASGFGKAFSVMVNVAGQDYMTTVQKFLDDLDLDGNTAAPNKTGTALSNNGSWLQDYDFIVPETWQIQKSNEAIMMSQTGDVKSGCLITILPPQASSGSLENDARAVFNKIYGTWQYRYTGEKKDAQSRGKTLQGLDYYMIEAPMQKQRPDGYYYDYENGQVLVIGSDDRIFVIIGQHERGEMPCFCTYQYEHWSRFFNSFVVKSVPPKKTESSGDAKTIVGSWKLQAESMSGQYIFAANGHYEFIGAYGTTSLISPTMVELRTSAFKGDGTYSLKGNQLTILKKGENPEFIQYRLGQVNRGGTGWKDQLFMLEMLDGKPNEVCYEKN
ncbi:MAG: hypothetical protein ACJ75B_11625 [Flavisolibacter sp.]